MSTMYNAVIDVGRVEPLDEYLDQLDGYHAVLAGTPAGTLEVIISLPAESLRQAATTALAVVEAAGLTPRTLDVLTSEDFDARHADDDGETISVAEAAELLGVTPSAVRQRLGSGSLPGRRVGRDWRLPKAGVEQLAAGQFRGIGPDDAAAIAEKRARSQRRYTGTE